MRALLLKLVVMVSVLSLFHSVAAFAAPYQLSYGGRLTEPSGKPVRGTVDLRVSFFRSETGADQVAVAMPDYQGVQLQDGMFQLSLVLSPADFHKVFNGTDPAFVQIEDLTNGVVYPRQSFSAVPYALKVPVDGESLTYNSLGQLSLGNGANILKLPSTAGALDKVLKSDGAGALVWADDLSGGGAGSITSTEIQDGTLTDADISGAAAIAASKISGLGGLATKSAVGSSDITDGSVTGTDIADGTITDADIHATANISYLKISGLGSAASKNVGTAAGDVAAGNHTHASGDISGLGSLATKSAVGSSDITDNTVASGDIADGTIVNADINASAAIAGSKITPDFGNQNVVTTGNATVATLQANTSVKLKSDNANTVTMQSPAGLAAGYTLILPVDDGTSGQVLTTDGSGGLTWDTVSGGGGDMFKANNLSELTDASAARSNLELGALATKSAVGSSDITDGSVSGTDIADGTITDADIHATANISYLKISGLGGAASRNVGTAAGTVAAGDHGHADATTGASGFMSAADKTKLDGIASGAGVDTNAKTLCADGTYLRGDDTTVCRSAAQIVSDASGVTTGDTGTVTSTMISDSTIANVDISPTAAIAGTKVNPNFGTQAISTSGNVSAQEVSASAYLKANGASVPAAAECDAAGEYGRIVVHGAGNKLYACTASGWQAYQAGASLPPGYVRGLEMTYNSASQIIVQAGKAVSDDDTHTIQLASNVTFDFANGQAANGAQGAEASDVMYDLYVIADSNGVNPSASFAVQSGAAVTLPSGYDKKRLIGAFRNDASGNIVPFHMSGKSNLRSFYYRSRQQFLNAKYFGWAAYSVAKVKPSSSKEIVVFTSCASTTAAYRNVGDTTNQADLCDQSRGVEARMLITGSQVDVYNSNSSMFITLEVSTFMLDL